MGFKEYLKTFNEGKSMKEWEQMLGLSVPIKPGYFDFNERKIVYRVADENSPKNIKKYEGKKGMWSGFTTGSEGLKGGVYDTGIYLYKLDALVQYDSKYDFYTVVDRNNYKWFDSKLFSKEMGKEFKKYFKPLIGDIEISYFTNKHAKIDDILPIKGGRNSYEAILDYLAGGETGSSKIAGQRKRDFIKWYYGTSKKIININKEKIEKEVKKEYKTSKSINSPNYDDYYNDEIVFNEYKVLGAWIITKITKAEKTKDPEEIKSFLLGILNTDFNLAELTNKEVQREHIYEQSYDALIRNNIKYLGLIHINDIPKITPKKPPENFEINLDLPKYWELYDKVYDRRSKKLKKTEEKK